jgi:response regulator RpfG family c-di-GMP phosphodiesterase
MSVDKDMFSLKSKQAIILVVDDKEVHRNLLVKMLAADGHASRIAASGEEALASVAEQLPDLILLDILMPGIDGFEVTRRLKANSRSSLVPIILVTALDDHESRLKGLDVGANDFLTKPVDRAEFLVRVRNLLKINEFYRFIGDHNRILKEQIEASTAEFVIANKELFFQNQEKEKRAAELVIANKELAYQNEEKVRRASELVIVNEELHGALTNTVRVAMILSEMRDPYTAGHQRRVAEIAVAISAELGFDNNQQEGMRVAGYLHDVGKIKVPAEILSKPGKLTDNEFNMIKEHAQAGYKVLNIHFPWPIAEVALQHHERMNGTGYPQQLKGDSIIIEARIMTVADTVEAMSSHRPYRAGLGIEKALAEVEHGRGTAYDTNVVDVCLKLFREKGFKIPD